MKELLKGLIILAAGCALCVVNHEVWGTLLIVIGLLAVIDA